MKNKQSQIWNSRLDQRALEGNVLFCAGRDVQKLPMADEILLPFDIWTNRAHCIMLREQNLISKSNLRSILTGLEKLEILVKLGILVREAKTKRYFVNQLTSKRTNLILTKENIRFTIENFTEYLVVILNAIIVNKNNSRYGVA